jgi:hypothetical protein
MKQFRAFKDSNILSCSLKDFCGAFLCRSDWEAMDGGIQGYRRADVVKSLQTSFLFSPPPFSSSLLLHGDSPCGIAGLEYVDTYLLHLNNNNVGYRQKHNFK